MVTPSSAADPQVPGGQLTKADPPLVSVNPGENEDIPQAAEPQQVSERLLPVPFRHTLEMTVVCVCLDTSETTFMNIKLLAYLKYNHVCPPSTCHVIRMIFHALPLLSEPSF